MNEKTKNTIDQLDKSLERLKKKTDFLTELQKKETLPYWDIIYNAGYANHLREYLHRNGKSLRSLSIWDKTTFYKISSETIYIPFGENGRILVKLWRGKTVWREFFYQRSELAPFLLAYIVVKYSHEFRFALIFDNERKQIGTYTK